MSFPRCHKCGSLAANSCERCSRNFCDDHWGFKSDIICPDCSNRHEQSNYKINEDDIKRLNSSINELRRLYRDLSDRNRIIPVSDLLVRLDYIYHENKKAINKLRRRPVK